MNTVIAVQVGDKIKVRTLETKINEIFSSIQGEGPVVGYKQLFIRFCGCNLNCNYCDTVFNFGEKYSAQELYQYIKENF